MFSRAQPTAAQDRSGSGSSGWSVSLRERVCAHARSTSLPQEIMDPAAVRNFSRQAAAYLEENEIYDLFESLLKTVILHQPDDPLQFMIDTLKQEVKVKVILMGPPGIGRSEYARDLATNFKVQGNFDSGGEGGCMYVSEACPRSYQ